MLPVIQGELGLVNAIKTLTEKGYTVSVPLIDNQDYDLVVDINGKLGKVQVKSSRTYSKYGTLQVQIKKVRSNKTVNNIYHFDNTKVDYVFIYEVKGRAWLIPSADITVKTLLSMNDTFNKYLIS